MTYLIPTSPQLAAACVGAKILANAWSSVDWRIKRHIVPKYLSERWMRTCETIYCRPFRRYILIALPDNAAYVAAGLLLTGAFSFGSYFSSNHLIATAINVTLNTIGFFLSCSHLDIVRTFFGNRLPASVAPWVGPSDFGATIPQIDLNKVGSHVGQSWIGDHFKQRFGGFTWDQNCTLFTVGGMRDFPICPITLRIPAHPVMAPDGVIYEGTAIHAWLEEYSCTPRYSYLRMTREDLLELPELEAQIDLRLHQAELEKELRNWREEKRSELRKTYATRVLAFSEQMREYLCPITSEVIRDPVKGPDERIYERPVINMWLEDHTTSPFDPTIQMSVDQLEEMPDLALKIRNRIKVLELLDYVNRS